MTDNIKDAPTKRDFIEKLDEALGYLDALRKALNEIDAYLSLNGGDPVHNKPSAILPGAIFSSWQAFNPIPGGSSSEIRKSVAKTKRQVTIERKQFVS